MVSPLWVNPKKDGGETGGFFLNKQFLNDK